MKKLIPFLWAKSIYDIDINFFKKMKCKYLFCDLDNTLEGYKKAKPSKKVIALIDLLSKEGIEVVIVSNNSEKRVETFCKEKNYSYIAKAYKPFKKKCLAFIEQNKINKDEIIFVGDQIFTDILCANRIGVKSILTEDIVKSNQLVTRFNKFFDKRVRSRLQKKGLLIDWRNYYGRINKS